MLFLGVGCDRKLGFVDFSFHDRALRYDMRALKVFALKRIMVHDNILKIELFN
jgi:hypothetical protein